MALKGLKVVELAGLAPGPFCGMILADFGALVIRVDKVEEALDIDCLANGKKSLALDIRHPKGTTIFRKLCKSSDVLIEPFRKGVMEKLGLGPDVLLADNPRLIYARLTGYGQSGIYSEKAGHDINFVAMSGLLSFFGRKSERPMTPLNMIADFGGGGLMCAMGIILALLERVNSGKGQVIDASMVDGAAYLGSWVFRSQNLPVWGNPRGENMLDGGAHYYEVYETKDGKYMAVGALESKFYNELIKGLGLSYEQCPQYGGDSDAGAQKALLKEKFLQKTQKEWTEIFDRYDACVTPVLSPEEAAIHPHNASRTTFSKCTDSKVSPPLPAPRLSRTPAVSMASNPWLLSGHDTIEILQMLCYNSDEILNFQNERIVKCAVKKSNL